MVNDAAEGFHYVTHQGFTFEPKSMIDSHVKVKSKKSQIAFYVVKEDGVTYIQNHIDGVRFDSWFSSFPFQRLKIDCKKLFCHLPLTAQEGFKFSDVWTVF